MTAEEKLFAVTGVEISIEKTLTKRGIVRSINAGAGEDVILLHGLNMGWGQWYPVIGELSRCFSVHALDLPGSGGSASLDLGAKEFGAVLVEAVDGYLDAKQFARFHVIGHSLGGWIALKLMLAERPGLDKAVLVSPLGFTAKTPRAQMLLGSRMIAGLLARTAMRPTRKHIESFLKGVLHDPTILIPEFIDYYYEMVAEKRAAHPFLFTSRLAGMFRVKDEFNLLSRVSAIRRPVMIVAGMNDPIVAFTAEHRKVFALIEGAVVHPFEKSGHVPFAEQPALFSRLVIEFLNSRRSP